MLVHGLEAGVGKVPIVVDRNDDADLWIFGGGKGKWFPLGNLWASRLVRFIGLGAAVRALRALQGISVPLA